MEKSYLCFSEEVLEEWNLPMKKRESLQPTQTHRS